jgi:molybdopterin-biosynthesis enzyme MoeA-like protein
MYEYGDTRIFCLQGVPSEMQAIFNGHILPEMKKQVGKFFLREINYHVQGVTEAMIAPALSRLVESNPRDGIYLKTHPQGYTGDNTPNIRIQLVSRGGDETEVKKRLDAAARSIREEAEKLGGKIISS